MYALLILLVASQVWGLIRAQATDKYIDENDSVYERAVFDDPDTNGIMQQIFRQNEANRELIKTTLRLCAGN